MKPPITQWISTLVLGACLAWPGWAAEFCVTNSTELQNALTTAASNDESNSIRVAAGTYDVPSGGFVYAAGSTSSVERNLTITGGWTEFFKHPCGLVLDEDPRQTVLNGGNSERVLSVNAHLNSNVTVRLLTFMNGNAPGQTNGGGLAVNTLPGHTGIVTIERNLFLLNEAELSGGLSSSGGPASNSRLFLVNNAFIANHARSNFGAARIRLLDDGTAGPFGTGIFAINNTMINNTRGGAGSGTGGLQILGDLTNPPRIFVINNNLWGNQGIDLDVDLSSKDAYALFNNNIGVSTGDFPSSAGGNINVAPVYEHCFLCLEWVPDLNSPLVDAGAHPLPPPFASEWSLPEYDLRGMPRVNSGRVDIGAYESHDRLFSDRFEEK